MRLRLSVLTAFLLNFSLLILSSLYFTFYSDKILFYFTHSKMCKVYLDFQLTAMKLSVRERDFSCFLSVQSQLSTHSWFFSPLFCPFSFSRVKWCLSVCGFICCHVHYFILLLCSIPFCGCRRFHSHFSTLLVFHSEHPGYSKDNFVRCVHVCWVPAGIEWWWMK